MLREARRDPWPEFLRLWSALLEEVNEGERLLLVEGEKDRTSVRRLGVRGEVVLVHHGASLSELSEKVARTRQSVTILTDWDTEGGHLAQRLKELLRGAPRIDFETRRRLGILLRGEVTHVEGLFRWARRTAEEEGAPLDHWLEAATG